LIPGFPSLRLALSGISVDGPMSYTDGGKVHVF